MATAELAAVPGTLDAAAFLAEHGHLPRLGKGPDPWGYRGWLLPYVQMAEEFLYRENSRWAYMQEIWDTGELPDRPIPRIKFGEPEDRLYSRNAVTKRLEEWSSINGWDMGGWSDFRVMVDALLWGLALGRDKPQWHTHKAAETFYRSFDASVFLRCPYDHFGAYISERKSSKWNPHAFFPTPHEVVECMVAMQFHDADRDGRDTRALTVCDPCLGTGRMLLHASNYSLRLYGMDIDPLVLACARINGAFYAPWLAYGLPDGLFPEGPALEAAGEPAAAGPMESPAEARGPVTLPLRPATRRGRAAAGQGFLFNLD